jgi:hypothetical protein
MKKIIFIVLVTTILTACEKTIDPNLDKNDNAWFFEQIKDISAVDTTLIRFTIGIKGNSAATGMCYCYPIKDSTNTPPTNKFSHGTFVKLSTKPLSYYFMNTIQVFNKKNKNVIYFQADSIGESLYKIKITFPDTTAIVDKVKKDVMDTLVFQASRKIITVDF